MKSIYLILTSIFLLTFGPFNSTIHKVYLTWNIIVFTIITLLIIISLLYQKEVLFQNNNLLLILCLVYAGMVLVNGAFHGIAFGSIPEGLNVNVMRHKAGAWRSSNLNFTILYLFFPVLFIIQYTLLRRVKFKVVIRFFASIITFSLIILFYQQYYDMAFLNKPYWQELQRAGGLSTDPNAFAMTAFLLLPLFVSGIIIEKVKSIKVYYLFLVVSLIAGVVFTGNRTALGGILLFILLLPVIIAFVNKKMNRHVRLALFVSPFILLLLIVILLPSFMNNFQPSTLSMERFILTLKGFGERGLESILTSKEQRVINYSVAWELLSDAPLAGWGPGGFYRESPTVMYSRTSSRYITDSALNHYLMIGGDLGLPTLIFNLVLIIFPLIIIFAVSRKLENIKHQYIAAILTVTNGLFLLMVNTIPPSYFPGLIWVWTAQLAYIVMLGENHNVQLKLKSESLSRVLSLLVIGSFVLVFSGSYQTTFGAKGYLARQSITWWPDKYAKYDKYNRNCYSIERLGSGVFMHWCKGNSSLLIPIHKDMPERIKIKLILKNPDIESNPVTVKYGGKSGPVNKLVVHDNLWKTLELPLTNDNVLEYRLPNEVLQRFFVLSLDVSRIWVPKEWDVNDDTRELGVAVMFFRKEMMSNSAYEKFYK